MENYTSRVYARCNVTICDKFYIRQTRRRFIDGFKEHIQKKSIRSARPNFALHLIMKITVTPDFKKIWYPLCTIFYYIYEICHPRLRKSMGQLTPFCWVNFKYWFWHHRFELERYFSCHQIHILNRFRTTYFNTVCVLKVSL